MGLLSAERLVVFWPKQLQYRLWGKKRMHMRYFGRSLAKVSEPRGASNVLLWNRGLLLGIWSFLTIANNFLSKQFSGSLQRVLLFFKAKLPTAVYWWKVFWNSGAGEMSVRIKRSLLCQRQRSARWKVKRFPIRNMPLFVQYWYKTACPQPCLPSKTGFHF